MRGGGEEWDGEEQLWMQDAGPERDLLDARFLDFIWIDQTSRDST